MVFRTTTRDSIMGGLSTISAALWISNSVFTIPPLSKVIQNYRAEWALMLTANHESSQHQARYKTIWPALHRFILHIDYAINFTDYSTTSTTTATLFALLFEVSLVSMPTPLQKIFFMANENLCVDDTKSLTQNSRSN